MSAGPYVARKNVCLRGREYSFWDPQTNLSTHFERKYLKGTNISLYLNLKYEKNMARIYTFDEICNFFSNRHLRRSMRFRIAQSNTSLSGFQSSNLKSSSEFWRKKVASYILSFTEPLNKEKLFFKRLFPF